MEYAGAACFEVLKRSKIEALGTVIAYTWSMSVKNALVIACLLAHASVWAQSANPLFLKSREYRAKENYTEAAKQLAMALKEDPGNSEFRKELADLQYIRRAFFEAIPLHEELLRDDPENVVYLSRLAEMYSMSPEKRKSMEYAERALALNPGEAEVLRMLAGAFLEVKHYPKAIACFAGAEKAMPQDKDLPFRLGECYAQVARYADAMRSYERALSLDPDNLTKIYETANACYDANAFERADELYQLAEDKGYFKSKTFFDNWALTCTEMKEYDRALLCYAKAKEFAPYDRDIDFSVAGVYMKKGDFAKARDVFDALLEINPEDAEVIYMKGMTYYKAGQTNKADPYFNRAFELDPSLKSLRYTKSKF